MGAQAAQLLPSRPSSLTAPSLQVVKLDPEVYLKWVSMPSTGHPVMFASPLIEKMTCTEWCGGLLGQRAGLGGAVA